MASQSVARCESIAAFIPELELLITEAMDEWKIPGLAVAVVQNGEVALVRAYGLRDVEAGLQVTTDTQFLIGSITKSFTATGLALLMDERRMEGRSRCGNTSRNSGCMTPSRPTASRCAICSAIIPGCGRSRRRHAAGIPGCIPAPASSL